MRRFYSHDLWCGSLSLRLDCYQSMLTRIWQQNHLQNVKNISAAENIVWSHRRPLSRGGSCWRRGRCGGTCSSDSDKYTLMGSWVCILHRITLIHGLYYWVVIFPIFSPAESTSYLWGSWFLAVYSCPVRPFVTMSQTLTMSLFLLFSTEHRPMRRRNTIAVIASRDLLTKIQTLQFLSSLHNLNGKMYIRWRKWKFPKSMLLNWMEVSIFLQRFIHGKLFLNAKG